MQREVVETEGEKEHDEKKKEEKMKAGEEQHNMRQDRQSKHIPEYSEQELQLAIDGLQKKGRAADTAGIKTGDLRDCDDETKEMMRCI